MVMKIGRNFPAELFFVQMKLLSSLILASAFSHCVLCIFFWIDPGQKRCFIEQMPKHTVFLANYTTLVQNSSGRGFFSDPSLNIQAVVESSTALGGRETLMNQVGPGNSRTIFTSGDAGEYTICFSPVPSRWIGNERVKMNLEVYIGEPGLTDFTPPVQAKLEGLDQTVSQLNHYVSEIRREQYSHRQRESEFKNRSEDVNSHVVYWMLLQIAVLFATGFWQMKHLERFFRTKKLV